MTSPNSSTPSLPNALPDFVRAQFEDTCKRRFLYGSSFECYGGVAGLYDFGPVGCHIKNNLLTYWRNHFILEENMLEIDTTSVTPGEVFKTSGHTERFTDVMVSDEITKELFRLDKYMEEWVSKKLSTPAELAKLSEEQQTELKRLAIEADGMAIEEAAKNIEKWGIKSPKGNPLTEPKHFNLMFPTPIGPGGDRPGYLRPELAQGIILNFKRLLEFNGGRMPFAGAAVGSAFRNEIAPRNNLLRVREFTLAEIEHFVNPNNKSHSKFSQVKTVKAFLYTRAHQADVTEPSLISMEEAVDNGLIESETMAYFIARTKLFLDGVGVKYLRFRQHRANEMAHYANDCWDAEILTSFGWTECVGIADRSCYDLTAHGKERSVDFVAYEKYPEPKKVKVLDRKVNKGLVNKTFKAKAQALLKHLDAIPQDEALALETSFSAAPETNVDITVDGEVYSLTRPMVSFTIVEKKEDGYNYTPGVIEPSFGVGRICYALLEQLYWVRKDEKEAAEAAPAPPADGKKKKPSKDDLNEKRAVFSLPVRLAPYKVCLMPLSPTVLREQWCQDLITKWREEFSLYNISYKVDDGSQGIGKKYARADEVGIPYDITIDMQTDENKQVTLRERDSTQQIWLKLDEVVDVLNQLCIGRLSWADAINKYPVKEG